ncbi:MAG: ABC transporter substrate-binding protein, partial [Ferrimicrobium sp.]|nr:ABC transporter substrate-binding protein [Ferrimicrobium sp.]
MKKTARRKSVAIIGTTAAAAMLLAACGSSSSSTSTSSSKPSSTAATKVKGGVAYFAEGPGANPNYIFPLTPSSDFSVDNLSQFQILMYRPLYFFGVGNKAELNPSLSLANPPVYSNNDKTVTITLKKY